jgi:hypothetical protein
MAVPTLLDGIPGCDAQFDIYYRSKNFLTPHPAQRVGAVTLPEIILAMLDTEILRRINNQKKEHTAHPFKAGSAGLDDFAFLYSRLQSIDVAELAQYLDLIDKVASGHIDCKSCTAKILVFCDFFTRDRLPERNAFYAAQYRNTVSQHPDQKRDYYQEVTESIAKQMGHRLGR